MGFKKWIVNTCDKNIAKELAYECDIEPILALIASARGYNDPAELEEFLSDEPVFSDCYEMADIMHAADIVNHAIEHNKRIAIYGDYDCDGVTATALLYDYLKSREADCIYYIPDRFDEGYGMNCNAVKLLHSQGIELIITVDNGISCIEEIELANNLGMTVIVTDHHLPTDKLPNAAAIVDPHRIDCPSEFKKICGAQVAFRLICVIEGKEPEELLPLYSDILTVAIIADVMPIIYENRSIVKNGIKKLKNSALTGLSALLNVSGIDIANVTAEKVAFSICPRINAAGRMGDANDAVKLLCEKNMLKALEIANIIDKLNSMRQQTEREIFKEAILKIEKNGYSHDRIIVVEGENWHQGVVGIVASRISERYGAPCIVLSTDGENAHGSGRSYEGFSLFDAISHCKDILQKFGGHALACGVSLQTVDIEKFRSCINEYAYNFDYIPPILKLDCKLNPSALTTDLAETLKNLRPFGFGNPQPLFGVFNVTLQRITPLSNNKHLKLLFTKDNVSFQALLFNVSTNDFCFELGDSLDLAITIDTNIFNGNKTVSIQIKNMRINNIEDDFLFQDINNYNLFCNKKDFDAKKITPTREEIGTVYKYITQNGVLYNKIINHFINNLGFAKTNIALDVLNELNLINKNENSFFKNINAEKSNLNNSLIFTTLIKECELDD